MKQSPYQKKLRKSITLVKIPFHWVGYSNCFQLEFNHLYKINVDESILDDIWSRAKYYTSYSDYLDANPSSPTLSDETDIAHKHRHQYNIFSITHKGNTVANIQLCTSPLVMGDIFQILADFTDTQYSCEQVGFPFGL